MTSGIREAKRLLSQSSVHFVWPLPDDRGHLKYFKGRATLPGYVPEETASP